MRISALLLPVFCFLSPVYAESAPKLSFPLECTLGETCWTARYNDRDEGPGYKDYRCGDRTQHHHRGTDFAIRNLGAMEDGVNVLTAAEGTVRAVRDTMPDISIREINPETLQGQECGNGIVINHAGGWSTQYCHMKQGSITVQAGDTVKAGDKLGEVGLSGETEYPHMHFTVRNKDGKRVDPYDGALITHACTAETDGATSLWKIPLAYEEMALTYVSLTTEPPTTKTRWDRESEHISPNSPALIVTGRVFGAQKGDLWLLEVLKPDGSVFYKTTVTLKQDRQFQLQYAGRKKPSQGFATGAWTGRVMVIRQRSDGMVLKQTQTTQIHVSKQ